MKIRLYILLMLAFLLAVVSCEQKPSTTEKTSNDQVYLENGKMIAGQTFAVLSGKLQAAIKEGGVSNALEYCNLAAYPLVDSLSSVYKADIRRTSMKIRNPKDAPTELEVEILEGYEKQAQSGKELKPMVKRINDQKIAFYAPIPVNDFCLQCHGKAGETLKQEDFAVIQKLYPADEAIGYVAGDLRGIWSITFNQ